MSKAKTPRVNKSKEEIAHEMHQRQAVERKRKFIGDVLFPLLKTHTNTVREAKMFCKIISNDILTTFNEGMKAKLSTLKIEEKFAEDDREGANAVRALVEAFKDTPINESLELLDGMPNAIDAALQQEDSGRLLSELDWGDGNLVAKQPKSFLDLLKETPLCNDFRQLGDGTWVAYSTKMGPDEVAIRAGGADMQEALINLRAKL